MGANLDAAANRTNLVIEVRDVYKKIRKFLIFVFVVALGASSTINNPTYKVSILIGLGVTLLFLIFDIYGTLESRLSHIETSLQSPKPEEYRDFHEVHLPLKRLLLTLLEDSREVKIQVIAVAARYSWGFIEDRIEELIKAGDGKCRLSIDIAVVRDEVLVNNRQFGWLERLRATRDGISRFRQRRHADLTSRTLSLNVFHYDNLPHWHGILVNGEYFYMGRTEWTFGSGSEYPELNVGEIEYRLFRKGDRFGGSERIKRFENWLDYYKFRSDYLEKSEAAHPTAGEPPRDNGAAATPNEVRHSG